MSDLFKDCLGEKFEQLAPLVRKAHAGKVRLEGDVVVERGNAIAQLVCNLFGMPPASLKCRLVVLGSHDAQTMTWNRHFDDHPMDSHFYKDGDYVVERLGPIHMKMALEVSDGVLTYSLAKTRIFGIPIPKFISPRVKAVEQQVEDKYRFSVVVGMPVVGMLVSYLGDMQVDTIAD
jgi:Domain of unknown function (DUF4166)